MISVARVGGWIAGGGAVRRKAQMGLAEVMGKLVVGGKQKRKLIVKK